MTNILYISWTEKMSGGEISIINYAKQLDKKEFRVVFLCPKNGMLAERLTKENIPVRFLAPNSFSFKHPWKFFISLAKLIKLIKKENINIIHNTTFYSNQIAVVAARICRIPVITHGQSFPTQKEIKRNLISYANKIIACSDAVKKSLLPHINEDKIEVMWHAVEIPKIRKKNFLLHKELCLQKNCILVGHIGLLEERKRQEDLIKAINTVIANNKNTRFLIIGNSPFSTNDYEQYLRNLVKTQNIEDKLVFLGFRGDTQEVINELDIVTLPSLNEPFALAMIEAMAFGKPFIGADSGGTPEIITHKKNGVLIPPKDSTALAKEINWLINNRKNMREIGKCARETIEQNCNIKTFTLRLSDIYNNLTKTQK